MRFSSPKRKDFEPHVQSGLSVTPEKMAELTKLGVPISSQNAALGFDELANVSDLVPMEYVRGISLNDLWNANKDAKKKAKKLEFEEPSNSD